MFMPESMPGDGERYRWRDVSSDLACKVVDSLEELKELFPENDEFGEIIEIKEKEYQGRKYIQYGSINKGHFKSLEPVAYKCDCCDKIVIGPPRVGDDTSIKDGHPLSGSLGWYVSCTNCNALLDSHIIMQSLM